MKCQPGIKGLLRERTCVVCKEIFMKKLTPSAMAKGRGKVCSMECKAILNGLTKLKPRVEKECSNCKRKFLAKQSEVKRRSGVKFCSQKCSGNAYKEKTLSTDGYWQVHVKPGTPGSNRGKMKEHRYVFQEFLCRPLLYSEIIHHKNHDKLDNRLENLELLTRKAHNKVHDFLRKKHD